MGWRPSIQGRLHTAPAPQPSALSSLLLPAPPPKLPLWNSYPQSTGLEPTESWPALGHSTKGKVDAVFPFRRLKWIDLDRPASIAFWKLGASGQTGAESTFFTSPELSVRAQSDLVLLRSGKPAQYNVELPDLTLAEAPRFARMAVWGLDHRHYGVTLHLSKTTPIPGPTFGSFGGMTHRDTEQFSIAPYKKLQIYSWFTGTAGYFVSASDEWWSIPSELFRGGSAAVTVLHPKETLKVRVGPAVHPDGMLMVLFRAETYEPFNAIENLGANRGNAILRAESDHIADFSPYASDDNDRTISVFRFVPPGDYVLEGWTDAEIKAEPTAPIYTI